MLALILPPRGDAPLAQEAARSRRRESVKCLVFLRVGRAEPERLLGLRAAAKAKL